MANPSTPTLPENADLGYLRRRARDLQRAVRAGDRRARELVDGLHPGPFHGELGMFPLRAAQLVVARAHGFASWPRLVRYFDVTGRYRWMERRMPTPSGIPSARSAGWPA
jgi:hypothetical protein